VAVKIRRHQHFIFSARHGRLRRKNVFFPRNKVKPLESIPSTRKECREKFSLNSCSNGFHVVDFDFDFGQRLIKEI
jgi:hypothetical protein